MVRRSATFCLALGLAQAAAPQKPKDYWGREEEVPVTTTEFKVTITNGLTECEEDDKIIRGDYIQAAFNGTILECPQKPEQVGKVFDRSIDHVEPYRVQIGLFQALESWDEGLVGLCAGACVHLTSPPEKAYGKLGNGQYVPPYSSLSFDICIEEVQDHPFARFNLFEHLDLNNDSKLSEAELLPFFIKTGDGRVPEDVWKVEDKDKDHFISWEEFGGAKGEPEKPKKLTVESPDAPEKKPEKKEL